MIFNDKVCESPSMGGNNLDIIGKGKVCSCASAFNFVSIMLSEATAE